MAEITPTSTKIVSMGNLKGTIASFANTADDADTWVSGIESIVHVIANQADTSGGSQTSTGCGASFSGGTITFHLAEDNSAVELLVLSGSSYG